MYVNAGLNLSGIWLVGGFKVMAQLGADHGVSLVVCIRAGTDSRSGG
jgi:hypothetical protein